MEGDVKLRFHLCQLRLNETVYRNLSVQRHNGKELATYPTVRSEIRTFSMQGNLTRFEIPNLFQNRVPDCLIVGLVDSRAFNGDVIRDPFCFQKFGLSSARQIVRGEEYPYETLQLVHDSAARDNLGYFRFLQASGAWCKKKGNTLVVPWSCLTMWPMDVPTVKDSTPSKRETYNSVWNLEPLPLPI